MLQISRVLLLLLVAVLMGAEARAQERLPPLTPEQMTDDQREIANRITNGVRGRVALPIQAWLRSPVVADRLQNLGEHLRYNSPLPARLNEFAILITAREWETQYEWVGHYPLAVKAGLKPEIAADLAAGKRPAGMQVDEAAVYDFSMYLNRNRTNVPDDIYEAVVKAVGEQGVIELVALEGYYMTVSMTLKVQRAQLPPGATPAWPLKAP